MQSVCCFEGLRYKLSQHSLHPACCSFGHGILCFQYGAVRSRNDDCFAHIWLMFQAVYLRHIDFVVDITFSCSDAIRISEQLDLTYVDSYRGRRSPPLTCIRQA